MKKNYEKKTPKNKGICKLANCDTCVALAGRCNGVDPDLRTPELCRRNGLAWCGPTTTTTTTTSTSSSSSSTTTTTTTTITTATTTTTTTTSKAAPVRNAVAFMAHVNASRAAMEASLLRSRQPQQGYAWAPSAVCVIAVITIMRVVHN